MQRQAIVALRGEAAANKAEAARQKASLELYEADVQHLREAVRDREQTIQALYGSTSWHVAAPLRFAAGLLRGRRGAAPIPEIEQAPPPAPAIPLLHPAMQAAPGPSAPPRQPRPRGSRGLMLVAADILPLFDQSSGGLRLKTLMELMGEAGWTMAFASLDGLGNQASVLKTEEGLARYEGALRAIGVQWFFYGIEQITGFLAETGRDLSQAFLSFPHVAAELMPLVRRYCPAARIAYDMVDFHGLRLAREARLTNDAALLAKAERQRAIEIGCARNADITIAVTDEERAAILEIAPEVVVETLPNVFRVSAKPVPGPEGRNGLLFVGGFWHSPNGDAMHWFVDRILPLIQREVPYVVLRIVGANPENDVLALGTRPGVEVLGFVPDLAPVFASSRVFVAPLRYGAGMKGKIGQSLVQGLPVVTTAIGTEGMALQDGVHVLVAETEAEFAARVLQLMRQDELWRRLAATGRAHIEATLSADAVRRQLEAILGG